VDESSWLACRDPQVLLEWLRDNRKLTERKGRLFCIAVCRRLWPLLTDARSREAVEAAERYADGATTDVAAAFGPADDAYWESDDSAAYGAYTAAAYLASTTLCVLDDALATATATEDPAELSQQADVLRDLFGDPFRALRFDPSLLTWNGGLIPQLAQAAYDDRILPEGTLDPARLAVLCDAVEEAGLAAPELISHLRGGSHYRGCHAIDALLGRS
jgi:hypothetical protein